ncbi:16602_t:CDS:2 [Rhizophagus irregularis]|nr:16602_t:CDS:2 [Rhizophagus irregularis]
MSAEIVFSIIILAIINIIFILDIIGCIFIFFRVSKIYALLNEKRMSPGIKFPFYLAITSYAIAGICHVILFIVIEGFFFKPDSIVQQQQESQQINDPETGIISSVENRQERPPSETVSK